MKGGIYKCYGAGTLAGRAGFSAIWATASFSDKINKDGTHRY